MGVFGALNAAVSGLTAQAYALENISGNIANSSTFGYKRLDTSFSDFVSGGGGPQSGQIAGGVAARSRATNNVAGDYLPFNDQDTFISISGAGYFVVSERIGDNGGQPIFSSRNLYTRAGDFEKDSAGRLVNGSGYYLLGRPIDPVTRSVSGSAPEIIRIDNSLIPAVRTNRIALTRGALPTSFSDEQGGNVNGPLNRTLTTAAGAGSPFSLGTRIGLNQITNANVGTFLDSSIGGGAITGFTSVGEQVNVQLQWAKSDDGDPTAKVYGTATLTGFPGAATFDGSALTLRSGNSVNSFVFDGTADQVQRFNDELGAAGYQVELVNGNVKISRTDGVDFTLGVNSDALASALGISANDGTPASASAVAAIQNRSSRDGNVAFTGNVPGNTNLSGHTLILEVDGNQTSLQFDNTNDQLGNLNTAFNSAGYYFEIDSTSDYLRVYRPDGKEFSISASDNVVGTELGFGNTLADNNIDVPAGTVTQNPSTLTGSATLTQVPGVSTLAGESITLSSGGVNTSYVFSGASDQLAALNAALSADGYQASLVGGNLQISRADGAAFDLSVSNTSVASTLGYATATGGTTAASVPPTKDTWGLYYNSNTNPQSPSAVAWQKLGDFQFDKETGALIYPVPSVLTIQNLAVNGRSLGEVIFEIPEGVLSQQNVDGGFQYDQNGFAAGEVVRTEISDSGRLVAIYSNGRQRDLYEIPVVTFAGEAELSRRDGGVFAETTESGQPIYAGGGTIVGKTVEGSNVDIADEFSKLIVTQQAYSANTRIITTADELLQESINIIR